jgi:hypothetical protein
MSFSSNSTTGRDADPQNETSEGRLGLRVKGDGASAFATARGLASETSDVERPFHHDALRGLRPGFALISFFDIGNRY